MEQLDAARDEFLDENDEVIGLVKDAKEAEKRLRHRLLSRFSRAMHDGWQASLSSSCLLQKTKFTNGIHMYVP